MRRNDLLWPCGVALLSSVILRQWLRPYWHWFCLLSGAAKRRHTEAVKPWGEGGQGVRLDDWRIRPLLEIDAARQEFLPTWPEASVIMPRSCFIIYIQPLICCNA